MAAVIVAGCSDPAEPEILRPAALEPVTSTTLVGTVGTLVTPTPTVQVKNQYGDPMSRVRVTFATSVGSGSLPSTDTYSTYTDWLGNAAVGAWRLGPQAGTQSLTASVHGLRVAFTVAATPGPIAAVLRLDGNHQSGRVGEPLDSPLKVRVTDRFLNPIADAVVSFTVISGGGSIDGGTATTDGDGIAVSGVWTLGPAAGLQLVRAQAADAEVVLAALGCVPTEPTCPFDDGRETLAFVRDRQIYRIALGGDRLLQLTSTGFNAGPSWSPDGSRLAFSRTGTISVMNADGTGLTELTNARGGYGRMTWSPDGNRIAYAGADGSIWVALADDTRAISLTSGRSPTWSPDGSQIAFLWEGDVYAINVDGSGRQLLLARAANDPSYPYYGQIVWSPDGQRFAVTVYANCDWDDECDASIGVLNLGGSEVRLVATGSRASRVYLTDPTWSPDGAAVAFTRMECSAGRCGESVRVVNADGSGERLLLENASDPSWRR